MVNRQQIQRQVAAILEANSLKWAESATGGMFLRFSSAGVSVEFVDWGTQTLIEISSHVLTGVQGKTREILREINDLNMNSHFGRWAYYRDSATIAVEYDLLGDHLQENELMTALAAVARLADHHDDLLQKKFGGGRAFEV